MHVSIIVPVYNVKEYLVKCLDSIAKQTLDDYEVIIVDDGSTDGSGDMIDSYCASKDKFKVFHKENGGLMSAWTFGVSKSTGDYLGFVDSDDYVSKDMFSLLYEKATDYDADIIMCDRFDVINDKVIEPDYKTINLQEGLYDGEGIETIRKMVFPLKGIQELTKARWNKLFKRELLISNLKYCECLSKTFEDRYITPACVFSAKSFYYLKKPLYYYIHRGGSNSGMYKPDLLNQIKRMYFVQEQALMDKGIMESYRDNWEYVFMDYIRQYVNRNIKNVAGFGNKLKSAKMMLMDELVNERLRKYGKDDKTKLGKVVYISYKFHAPILLAIASYM